MSREQWVEKIIINIFYASDIHIWTITLFNITKHFFSLLSLSFPSFVCASLRKVSLPSFFGDFFLLLLRARTLQPFLRNYFCYCAANIIHTIKISRIKLVFVIVTEMLTSCQGLFFYENFAYKLQSMLQVRICNP